MEKARKIITLLEVMATKMHVGKLNFAFVYAGLGEIDRTFENLEIAGQERTGLLIFLAYFAQFLMPKLNNDPRFEPFLKKTNIPLYKR